MSAVPSSAQKVLDQGKDAETGPLRVHYTNITVTKPGSSFGKPDVATAPTLSVSSSITKSANTKYIAITLDLDAPAPSFNVASPILHWLQAHLTIEGQPDADGFAKLVSSEKPAAPYLPPNPPFFSTAHRYVFMLWEQPADLTDNEEIKSRLNLPEDVTRWQCIRWDQDGCEKKLGLKEVLGGNYMLVQ
jgi:phosphatidylethanolamine-binding protein (PEBP) family uncharacterized protein